MVLFIIFFCDCDVVFSQIPTVHVWWTSLGYVCVSVRLSGNILNGILIDVRFNDRWHTFTPTAAKGGQVAPIQADII